MYKVYVEHTFDLLQDRWPILRICKFFVCARVSDAIRCLHSMANMKSPVFLHNSETNILNECYSESHKLGDCTISNCYRVSKYSTYSLFTDTNVLSEIFNSSSQTVAINNNITVCNYNITLINRNSMDSPLNWNWNLFITVTCAIALYKWNSYYYTITTNVASSPIGLICDFKLS